jgi:hypothetical protein
MRLPLPSTLLAGSILLSGSWLASFAQSGSYGKELSQPVHFEVGETHFLSGDSITIDSVHGTADTVAAGNLYEIKGHYTLASHPTAELAVNVTSRNAGPTTGMQLQHVDVNQGNGTFTVYLYMWGEGWPHLSFYPTGGGSSFSALYFGNGNTLMRASNAPPHDSIAK